MNRSDPFWRACALALAWCLVGLGIDPGPDGQTRPTQPAANAQRGAWVPNHFATERSKYRVPTCPPERP